MPDTDLSSRPDFRFTRYRPGIPDLIIRRRLAGHGKRQYTRFILLDGQWQRAGGPKVSSTL